MVGRHSKAKHRLDTRQDDHRLPRTIHMVDLRTGLTHLLTPDAAAADLVALCGRALLPAALVDPGTGYCWACRSTTRSSIPSQRSSG
jgi:hypothetical protein